jgi:hypothetical protein
MNVTFALFADAANLSQEGKLNILGVFDAVQVATLPTVHPRAHLVVHLKGSPLDAGPHSVTLRWLNPEAQEMWSTVGELNVGPPPPGVTEMDMPLIAALDLPLERSGTYTMAIAVDDQPVVQVPLHVRGGVPVMRPGALVS